jgi:hypothetical protein
MRKMRHGLQDTRSLWVYYGYLVNIIALSCNHGGDDRPDMDLLMRIEKDRPEVRPLKQKAYATPSIFEICGCPLSERESRREAGFRSGDNRIRSISNGVGARR